MQICIAGQLRSLTFQVWGQMGRQMRAGAAPPRGAPSADAELPPIHARLLAILQWELLQVTE